MAQTGSLVIQKVLQLLRSPGVLEGEIARLSQQSGAELKPILPEQVLSQNISVELAERSAKVRYPVLYVYVSYVQNQMREKFRSFSGIVRTTLELRVSHERAEVVTRDVGCYLDALTEILTRSRGDWGQGMFFNGGYEIEINPAKSGGRNFVQAAKISFDVNLSLK
ncbi:MAG: hypothetical protein IRZ15_09450 [Bryobacteraceae bacterium]|nr:hypothetical protein [Bryobacteraceae bacterium]